MAIKPITHYVISGYVDSEDGTLYWSNEDGWVFLSDATVFTKAERETLNLPEGEAEWIALPAMPDAGGSA